MKTNRYYQTVKPSKKQPTGTDILKAVGYYGAMFTVALGIILLILSAICSVEFVSNLFK